jgi:prepilin-type N-terminal cleavage/methylation domain-containing protein
MKILKKKSRGQSGFTLIEAMISIIVLSIGILSLAAVYAEGLTYASLTQYDYIAEKKAEEAVEAIFSARDNGTLTWASIQNVSQGGVFIDTPQRMLQPGTDGLVGTATASSAPDDVIVVGPNSSGQIGTSTDEVVNLNPWMTRTIAITPVTEPGVANTNLRMITVTIDFQVGKLHRTHTLVSYISAFA